MDVVDGVDGKGCILNFTKVITAVIHLKSFFEGFFSYVIPSGHAMARGAVLTPGSLFQFRIYAAFMLEPNFVLRL